MDINAIIETITEFFTKFITYFDTEAGGIVGQLVDFFKKIAEAAGA